MKENPKHIRISEYNYPLPEERIAKFPLPVRDQSKLLVYRQGAVTEDVFTSLPKYLAKDSLMIFNNTKVIQARLHFRKETGALIEVFCLEPVQPNDYALNFQQTEHAAWLCMIGNLKKWKGFRRVAHPALPEPGNPGKRQGDLSNGIFKNKRFRSRPDSRTSLYTTGTGYSPEKRSRSGRTDIACGGRNIQTGKK